MRGAFASFVLMLAAPSPFGCRRGVPADAHLLSEVVHDDPVARTAAQWSMPLSDARTYLSSSDGGCPLPMSRLPQSACLQAPPGQGLSPDAPLAWGSGSAAPLWHGRLRCHTGATPQVIEESLGVWLVRCAPEEPPQRWFTDADAPCGSPCPPAGLSVMPADALHLEHQVSQALDEQRTGDALHLAGVALSRYPLYASTWRLAGVARAATGDHTGAILAFDEALARDPADVLASYYAARSAHSAAMWPEARDRASALLPRLDTPTLQAEVQCIEAIARIRLGDAAGPPLAVAACASGAVGCCQSGP